jgi:hypothetical protein
VDSVNRVQEATHIALDPIDFVPIANNIRSNHLIAPIDPYVSIDQVKEVV